MKDLKGALTQHLQQNSDTYQLVLQRQAIEAFVRSRGIKWVMHFTPVQNLLSIAQDGLLTRIELQRRGITGAVFPDRWRSDHAPWATCCSIQWPNNYMLYRQEQWKGFHFAIFLLDPSILWELNCIFVPGNSSRADLSPVIPRLRVNSSNRLAQLKALYPDPDPRQKDWQAYPLDVQAEVLVDEPEIDLQTYGTAIAFKYQADCTAAQQIDWPEHMNCLCFPELFSFRPDC